MSRADVVRDDQTRNASSVDDLARRPRFKWSFAAFFTLMHGLAFLAPWFFTWRALILMLAVNAAIGIIGMSLCYHRLLTHRSFRVPKWMEYIMTTFGALALQGGPESWVGMHRFHHAYADSEKDPHSAKYGFWWSHVGWMFFYTQNTYRRYAPKFLREDRYYRFLNRHFIFPQVPLGVILYLIGGWPFVIYGIFLRVVVFWHCTFLVNSATHLWGYRNYETRDNSRNTWWVAILTYGEGWHNNHHADPQSAKYGRRFWEIDLSWMFLRLLLFLRLARSAVMPHR